MSLLIKALKRAERRNDGVRQSGESLPPVPVSISTQPAPERPVDASLAAVDAAEPDLQLEVAQFQQGAAGEQQPGAPAEDSTQADAVTGPGPEANRNADSQLPQIDFALESAQPAVVPDRVVPETSIADSAAPALKLSLQDNAPGVARPADPVIASAAAARDAGSFEPAPAGAVMMAEPGSGSRSSEAQQPAGSARTRSPKVAAKRQRVMLYSAVGVLFIACAAWMAVEFLGIAPWQKQPRGSFAAMPVTPPASAPAADTVNAGNTGDQSGADSRASGASADPADSSQRRAAGSTGKGVSVQPRDVINPGAAGPRRVGPVATDRQTKVSALGRAESVAVRRSEPASGDAQVAAASVPATGVPAGIRLSRDDTSAQQILQLNDRAWTALSRNDLTSARQAYEASLKIDRNNIDAWLGLASLAARAGDIVNAEHHYRRALDIDPNDGAARAGLLALTAQQEPSTAESRLRGLIDREGAQPPMMFALGNSLAAQLRWADAQAAYFAAFSGDPANADYAFNLAISLEHIRQPAMAASFYRKSLELAARRPGRFDRAQAERRLATLAASADATSRADPVARSAVLADGARE